MVERSALAYYTLVTFYFVENEARLSARIEAVDTQKSARTSVLACTLSATPDISENIGLRWEKWFRLNRSYFHEPP